MYSHHLFFFGHDGEKHDKNDSVEQKQSKIESSQAQILDSDQAETQTEEIMANFDDFPYLHPLKVHFPIVLLLIGAGLAIINVIFLKKEIDRVIIGVGFLGALGAYLSGETFHPHTHDLSKQAKQVLVQHELWVDWTIYLSIAGFLAQLTSQFILKQKRLAIAIVALILVASGYAVSQAGHFGAQLVYIEGVGPWGEFLESEGAFSLMKLFKNTDINLDFK